MITGPSTGGRGWGSRTRMHWLYVTGKPEIHKLLFLSYKWSLLGVFFRSWNGFCDPLSRHRFQNIPHPNREKIRIPVPRGWFHPASRFWFPLYPASRLDFKSYPASHQIHVGPSFQGTDVFSAALKRLCPLQDALRSHLSVSIVSFPRLLLGMTLSVVFLL